VRWRGLLAFVREFVSVVVGKLVYSYSRCYGIDQCAYMSDPARSHSRFSASNTSKS
jgi:hypothetical protein